LGFRVPTFGALIAEAAVRIIVDGKIVGAIGVSSAASHQDGQVAKADTDAVK
jgi:uncharacterized protein GlcG (DUF336 family)